MQARTIPLFLVSLIVLLPPGSQSGQSAECVNQFTKSVIRLYPDKSGAVAKKINVVDLCHAITPNYRQVDVMGGYTSAAGCGFV